MLVAVTGKFGGAFIGASLAGSSVVGAPGSRHLDGHPGLTAIVILAVGLQRHILDQSPYSLMIVMAIVMAMMPGLLLHLVYPDRFALLGPPVTCSVSLLYAGCHERTLVRR